MVHEANERLLRSRLAEIVERMGEISRGIEERAGVLDADVISMRRDPVIEGLWNKLCLLHMRGVVICEGDFGEEKPGECEFISSPQACIQKLHLAEEETCCQRFIARVHAR